MNSLSWSQKTSNITRMHHNAPIFYGLGRKLIDVSLNAFVCVLFYEKCVFYAKPSFCIFDKHEKLRGEGEKRSLSRKRL